MIRTAREAIWACTEVAQAMVYDEVEAVEEYAPPCLSSVEVSGGHEKLKIAMIGKDVNTMRVAFQVWPPCFQCLHHR